MRKTDREGLSACGAAARAGGEVRSAKVHRIVGPPLTPCWRGEVRSARRKGWTAAHAPLRRAVRSAAAHAARHALSTSRSVLRTDHLRTNPSYLPPSSCGFRRSKLTTGDNQGTTLEERKIPED